MKLTLIGGGNMGEAIVSAVLKARLIDATDICVVEQVDSRRQDLSTRYGVRVSADALSAIADAKALLMAIKPQDFDKLAASLHGRLDVSTTVVSIMAGVTISRLLSGLGVSAVVRAMPNTPAQVGEGMTVWTATPDVSSDALVAIRGIFASMGREAQVPEERYLDMATAISGSGPAYVFLFIEALIDAGVLMGLTRDLAKTMALQTVLGSAHYAEASANSIAELRNQVTSPGGTTAAALRALEAHGFRDAIMEAVTAAYEKSRSLGEAGK